MVAMVMEFVYNLILRQNTLKNLMRSPKFIKLMLLIPIYPVLYYAWVNQIKNSWVILLTMSDIKRYQRFAPLNLIPLNR